MEIADNARLRKSIKISLEHKFIKQKAEFLDSVEKQMQAMQQKMASQIQENHQQLINANIRVSLLERKNEEKQRIIAEQELLLRNYATTLTSVATQSSVVEEQLDSQEYKKQIEDLKMKNLRLSLKLAKVLGYFVEFKLYNNEYAQRVEKDECPCEEIRKPKLHQHQDLLDQLTNNEKFYQALAKQHLEVETLKKENFEIRKKLIRHNLTETLDIESQKRTINTLGQQVDDQKRYIEGLLNSIRQKNRTTTCKTLNDILIKKRVLSVEGDEPVFDVNQQGRKVIADRLKLSQLSCVAQVRLHTQNY